MSLEFFVTSLLVILLLGTGVLYTIANFISHLQKGYFCAVRMMQYHPVIDSLEPLQPSVRLSAKNVPQEPTCREALQPISE